MDKTALSAYVHQCHSLIEKVSTQASSDQISVERYHDTTTAPRYQFLMVPVLHSSQYGLVLQYHT